jgi:hypothetical protein
MSEPELLQLIDRVTEQLDNNWAVSADDIRALLELAERKAKFKPIFPYTSPVNAEKELLKTILFVFGGGGLVLTLIIYLCTLTT